MFANAVVKVRTTVEPETPPIVISCVPETIDHVLLSDNQLPSVLVLDPYPYRLFQARIPVLAHFHGS